MFSFDGTVDLPPQALALSALLQDAVQRQDQALLDFFLARPDLPVQELFFLAAHFNQPEVLTLLLDQGAMRDAFTGADYSRQNALMLAARNGSLTAAQALLTRGALVNAQAPDRYGSRALHHAVMGRVESNRREMVRLLLAHGADPRLTDNEHDRPEELMHFYSRETWALLRQPA